MTKSPVNNDDNQCGGIHCPLLTWCIENDLRLVQPSEPRPYENSCVYPHSQAMTVIMTKPEMTISWFRPGASELKALVLWMYENGQVQYVMDILKLYMIIVLKAMTIETRRNSCEEAIMKPTMKMVKKILSKKVKNNKPMQLQIEKAVKEEYGHNDKWIK